MRARALEVQTQSIDRFVKAESIYRQVLSEDSVNLDGMTGLAATLAVHADWLEPSNPAQQQKLTEARDLALAVKAVDPTNSRLYIPLALYSQHVNDFDSARKTWQTLVALNPNGPGAHNNVAVFRITMGEPARAIPLLERSLELHPRGNVTAFAALGAANFALGEDERAIEWLLKALDMNFENLDMFSFLAMAYANQGNAAKSAIFTEEYRR